jgi:outer membrane murein-binding lipoprotein Lpp
MKNKIILVGVLLMVIAISGCINSDIDAINQIMPKLSDNIESGDVNFNSAVNALNSNNVAIAYSKANTAIDKYNSAKSNLEDIQKYSKNLNDTEYIEYINLISDELDFKINASSNLQSISNLQAINQASQFQIDNYNNEVSNINYYMREGVKIQNKRNNIVKNNLDKFG